MNFQPNYYLFFLILRSHIFRKIIDFEICLFNKKEVYAMGGVGVITLFIFVIMIVWACSSNK